MPSNSWFSRKGAFSYFDNKDNQLRIKIVFSAIKKYSLTSATKKPKILDIGCGDGRIAEQIKNNTNCIVYGIDSSKKNVTICQNLGVKAKVGDVEEKFPYANNFLDIVFAGEIIEHLFDTKKFLLEIRRVLKPNGVLILTTPNLAHLPERFRLLSGLNPANVTPIHEFLHFHIRPFTLNTLTYALELTGFDVMSVKSTLVVFKWNGDEVALASRLVAWLRPTLGNTFIVEAKKINL